MTQAIKPCEIGSKKLEMLPEFVIESFNRLIARNYCNGTSRVLQDEVIDEIMHAAVKATGENLARSMIFDMGWLDVEPIFEQAGWDVKYDKPGYNESGNAFFIFTRKD